MPTLPTHLRIATRESRLALAQTHLVAETLRSRNPGLKVEIVGMTTRGDTVLDRPLSQVGGKGLFIKELEVALVEERAEIAVHSMKDVPMEIDAAFALTTFGTREDPRDAFVSAHFESLDALPAGSVVGTSSLRRECQLRSAFPKLQFKPLRGNVNTRLAKLDAGDYDAIILAAAGLRRLGFEARIRTYLPPALAIPAIGQGILAIEHLAGRDDIAALLRPFRDPATKHAARAERAFGLVAEGSCEVPVGALAHVAAGQLSLEAFIGLPDGTRVVRDAVRGDVAQDEALGRTLGEKLLAMGGREILAALQRANA
ncbi:hydroxymethylbilane synthase [Usitatibacter palustris]|uniref:Porphobilinogen deaminase n=1 Tax=Usitatibacter palustris TaxID=2732487 RepID=A0A6M4HCU1_9PROT|nr:hydroxymethylbilane synthase [Usitatibacter palustris]QJR16895.1 Porphobilinogen deaminase [Usitatibacter palustris]